MSEPTNARVVSTSIVDPSPPAPARSTSTPRLPTTSTLLLAICSGVSVANVYYAQPLLDAIAADLHISQAAVGGAITATQFGSALALLFLVPLGDLLRRKHLICAQLVLLMLALTSVVISTTPMLMLVAMLFTGMLGTAMTQGLIAYSAALAHEAERGRVVGIVQSGVLIGLLGARSLAGLITDLSGWRSVYFVSCLMTVAMLIVLMRLLPTPRIPSSRMTYWQMLESMGTLLATERILQVRGVLGLLMFAAFGTFWSALVLPLSAPPYHLTHTSIGAFGLIGVVGAIAAARAGHWTDLGYGQRVTGLALLCLLLAWIPIAALSHSISVLIVGIVLLDMGAQAIHVANQGMILNISPEAHSRLVGCYMLFYSAGSGIGAISATYMYARCGWLGVCGLGSAISLAALVFWGSTRRWMHQR